MSPEDKNTRRYSLFSKTLKSVVEPTLRPVLKQHGVAASKIIAEWQNIVGVELARYTLPVKLTFSKEKNSGGVLTVACEGAHALTLQHIQPIIIERIAGYFGYKAVARITIEQRPIAAAPTKKITAKKHQKVDKSLLDGVEDEELKAALSQLANSLAGDTL